MPKFFKKPVVIDAFQITRETRWDNSNWPRWLQAAWNKEPGEGCFWCDRDNFDKLSCGTLEGVYRVSYGDWIIRGVHGEIYPCKPDIFEETYLLYSLIED